MFSFGRRLHRSCETIRKYFASAGCSIPSEPLKNHVVTLLCIGRTIPRPVEGDEHAIPVARWKLFLVVPHHRIWRPMRRKFRSRTNLVRANANFLAVSTVFRRENQLLHKRVVVALRPPVVS